MPLKSTKKETNIFYHWVQVRISFRPTKRLPTKGRLRTLKDCEAISFETFKHYILFNVF